MGKENWYFVTIEILELESIQIRQLKTDVDLLRRLGEINSFFGEPRPLRYFDDGKARSITIEEKSEKDDNKNVSFVGANLDPVTSHF